MLVIKTLASLLPLSCVASYIESLILYIFLVIGRVTALEVNPNTGDVFSIDNNFVLRARIPKTGIFEIIWRFNNFNLESGIRTSPIDGTQAQETSLEIRDFSYADHLGDYSLLVTNPAGTMTVSKWRVLQPGEQLTNYHPLDSGDC